MIIQLLDDIQSQTITYNREGLWAWLEVDTETGTFEIIHTGDFSAHYDYMLTMFLRVGYAYMEYQFQTE